MRIGITGQPCIDAIVYPGMMRDKPKQALGGVLYSFAAMERILRERGSGNDSFVPITWLSRPDRASLEPLLGHFHHMDRSAGLWPSDSQTNRVQLVYQENGDREEHCPHILPRLTLEEFTPSLAASLDGLFVNMISGFDIGIDTLEIVLRESKQRPFLHLDVHALILGVLSEQGHGGYGLGREPHGAKEWRRWLAIADSVQMNENEVRWFADPEFRSEEDLLRAIERMEEHERPRQLILTRASRGASLYLFGSGEAHHVPVPKITAVETTGSGDVFGSAYLFSILQGKPPEAAMREAVGWASWKTTLTSIEQILDAPLFPSNQ
ncbi:MAG TPA: carbohydrate kinase family protein [Candidatus Kapabacteria bacterium]|nr:carbohydrate kinase family protein [Candidatus Kapabacteria bacterium]